MKKLKGEVARKEGMLKATQSELDKVLHSYTPSLRMTVVSHCVQQCSCQVCYSAHLYILQIASALSVCIVVISIAMSTQKAACSKIADVVPL